MRWRRLRRRAPARLWRVLRCWRKATQPSGRTFSSLNRCRCSSDKREKAACPCRILLPFCTAVRRFSAAGGPFAAGGGLHCGVFSRLEIRRTPACTRGAFLCDGCGRAFASRSGACRLGDAHDGAGGNRGTHPRRRGGGFAQLCGGCRSGNGACGRGGRQGCAPVSRTSFDRPRERAG